MKEIREVEKDEREGSLLGFLPLGAGERKDYERVMHWSRTEKKGVLA